ncbi:MAG TPA: FAD-dependent monooxygenase [Polyangiales bacterium]|nr:FAD-dependent monooxygenase [Polyangiales bacterium]
MQRESTYVLIVGGSLVGSSAALFLAHHGVPAILVERHPGSSAHPRAIGYTPRTMELLASVGLGSRIPEAPRNFRLARARVESLAGEWFEHSHWTPSKPEHFVKKEFSPSAGAAIAQDRMEPILRERANELGADIRMSTELVDFTSDADGVTARVRTRQGSEYTIHAAYMIAADGGKSPVREQLGIGHKGRGHMRTVRSVLFRAPLDSYLERGVHQFEIDQPDFKAFLTTYTDGRWILMFSDDQQRCEAALRNSIVKAIGRTDLDIEIITTGRWELGALVAEQFSKGRVFLAGDAAHCLPPTRGGYGANTGIHDAHNLAWKLAAVFAGTSTPALLETYDAERRPVAWTRHQQIFARPDYKEHLQPGTTADPIIDDEAMELGQLYRSSAVSGAGSDLPEAKCPDEWQGQPGTRAQHLALEQSGTPRSTLDLFGHDWVLLSEDARWSAPAANVSKQLGIAIQFIHVGKAIQLEDPQAFQTAFGVSASGASLVRPDGHVAWRAAERPTAAETPETALLDVMKGITHAAIRIAVDAVP